jgi:hypothetical protein
MTTSQGFFGERFEFFHLAGADVGFHVMGRLSFWVISPTTSTPAVSAVKQVRRGNLQEKDLFSAVDSTPAKKARSRGGVVGWGIFFATWFRF